MDKAKLERLQELNGIKDVMRGQEVNKAIRDSGITESNEMAIQRKQINAILEALNLEPLPEYKAYNDKVEEIKHEV